MNIRLAKLVAVACIVWSTQRVAAQAPYPPSPVIGDITWDFASLITTADRSDLWPTTWGADSNLYTSWGDGTGFQGPDSGLGFAKIEGPPESFVGTDLWRRPREGGKVTGMISIGGRLYAWLNNTQDLPPPAQRKSTQLGWSDDYGLSWNWASWGFSHSGAVVPSSILNFGKDNSGARDNYVYLYGGAWFTAGDNDVHLTRVPNDQMTNQGSYEFFAGFDSNGVPTWTSNMNSSVAVFSDPNSTAFNGSQLAAVSYIPAINRYIFTISHAKAANLGVFDAPEPWGPWTTVQYNTNWGGYGGEEPLLYYFPTKWISADGNTMWMVFSGSGVLDSFNVIQATLTVSETVIACTEQSLLDAITTANSSGGGIIKFNCQDTTILMSQGLGILQDSILLDGESKNITLEYTTDFTGCVVGDGFPSGDVPIAQIQGQNNIIRGLTFKNYLESIQISGPNNTIENNTFFGHLCSDDAVSTINVAAINTLVQNNHFQDYEDKAFQMSFGGGTIANNTFLDTQQPIRGPYDNSLGGTFYITDNQMLTTGDTAECTGVTIDGIYSIRFEGNTLKCQRGLRLGGGTEIIIDNNTIDGNDRVGIRIGGNALASVSNNSVTNNGFAGGSLPSGGIVVWENAQADLGGGSLVIDGQTVSSSGNNILTGNGVADVRNLRASYTLKAENNCWDNQNLVDVQNLDTEGDVEVDPLSCTSSSDTTPPTVSITSPTAGSTVSSVVTISASASDDVAIQSVQFQVDGTSIATDTTSPYSTSWVTTTIADGSHSLTAVATDTSGNITASSAVLVTVSNVTPPTASLSISNLTVASGKAYQIVQNGLQSGALAYIDRVYTLTSVPASLQGATYIRGSNSDKAIQNNQFLSFDVNQTVTVYVAHDDLYQTKPDWLLSFQDSGQDLFTGTSFSIFQKAFPAGTVILGGNEHPAEAAGNSMYIVIIVGSDEGVDSPPTVSITSPTAGSTVSGAVSISASASDDIGVQSVQLKVDGAIITTDTTSPYSTSWDTTTIANGSHNLTAVATDTSGNTTTSTGVTVNVNNGPPPPSDTTPPTVSITSPTAGSTISGTATISASASDNVGIQSVQFQVDGASIATDTTAPYSTSWNTTAAANGSHSLIAVATDSSGNMTGSPAVTVNVSNTLSGQWYYIDANHVAASDNNLGTDPNLPWKTIDKANLTLESGDTVQVVGGTYLTPIKPGNTGTSSSARITYVCPSMNCTIQVTSGNTADTRGQSWIKVDGFIFKDGNVEAWNEASTGNWYINVKLVDEDDAAPHASFATGGGTDNTLENFEILHFDDPLGSSPLVIGGNAVSQRELRTVIKNGIVRGGRNGVSIRNSEGLVLDGVKIQGIDNHAVSILGGEFGSKDITIKNSIVMAAVFFGESSIYMRLDPIGPVEGLTLLNNAFIDSIQLATVELRGKVIIRNNIIYPGRLLINSGTTPHNCPNPGPSEICWDIDYNAYALAGGNIRDTGNSARWIWKDIRGGLTRIYWTDTNQDGILDCFGPSPDFCDWKADTGFDTNSIVFENTDAVYSTLDSTIFGTPTTYGAQLWGTSAPTWGGHIGCVTDADSVGVFASWWSGMHVGDIVEYSWDGVARKITGRGSVFVCGGGTDWQIDISSAPTGGMQAHRWFLSWGLQDPDRDGISNIPVGSPLNSNHITFTPVTASPVVDAGDNATCGHAIVGSGCDIGPVEVGGSVPWSPGQPAGPTRLRVAP